LAPRVLKGDKSGLTVVKGSDRSVEGTKLRLHLRVDQLVPGSKDGAHLVRAGSARQERRIADAGGEANERFQPSQKVAPQGIMKGIRTYFQRGGGRRKKIGRFPHGRKPGRQAGGYRDHCGSR